jgi:hypothetical protein
MSLLGKVSSFALLCAFLALCTSADARRGLGGNLGIVYCPLKAALISYPSIPATYDLRDAWPQCMSPILNQGNCGWFVRRKLF